MEKKNRVMEHISDPNQKKHILTNYLFGKELNVNENGLLATAQIITVNDDTIIIKLSSGWDFEKFRSFKMTAVLARYVEIDCNIVAILSENKVEVKVKEVGIAKKDRSAPRVPVNEEGFLKVTNIISSKTIIEANMFNIPTLVRVNFEEYEKKIQALFEEEDYVSIQIFGEDLDRELEIVKKEMRPLLLQDTLSESSYQMSDPHFINYVELIDDQIATEMKKYRDSQILSLLILPIVYTNELEEQIPIGYVHAKSKSKQITEDLIHAIQTKMDEMIQRIKDANLIKTEDKFPVLDVSTTGLRMIVNHPKLTETLPKQKGFGFDIVFKMQTPFRLFAKVAWSKLNPKGELLLGLEIIGIGKSKVEKARFQENIEILKQLNLSLA